MAYIRHDFEKIGKRIKDERKALGISSLDKMSEKLDNDYSYKISRQALSDIEKGRNTRAFTVDLIDIFCEMFQCDAAYLLCEYDDCKTYDKQFIHDETGLSEKAIEKVCYFNAHAKHYIEPLNIILKSPSFESALHRIPKYMADVQAFEILQEQRRIRRDSVYNAAPDDILENGQPVYNCPYNDSHDKDINAKEKDMILQEYTIDDAFKHIIQELKKLAKREMQDTD